MLLVTSIYNGIRSRLVVEKSFPGASVITPAGESALNSHSRGRWEREGSGGLHKKEALPDLV
jgi:hypothetical protein